jgi:hypothetical protein
VVSTQSTTRYSNRVFFFFFFFYDVYESTFKTIISNVVWVTGISIELENGQCVTILETMEALSGPKPSPAL